MISAHYFRPLVFLALLVRARGYGDGYTDCTNAPRGPHTTAFGTGANPFRIELTNSESVPVGSWEPGVTYTLSVVTTSGVGLRGLLVSGFAASQAALGTAFVATAKAGRLDPVRAVAEACTCFLGVSCALGTSTQPSRCPTRRRRLMTRRSRRAVRG